jgi:hypothetical protein
MGQQCVGGDIKRQTDKNITGPLVELTGKLSIGHIKLKKAVTGGEGHLVYIRRVPGHHKETSGIRIFFDLLHNLGDLVNHPSIGTVPGTPLVAVDRP